jgi:hypothetical protein
VGQFAELLRIIDFGKACGYIPSGHFDQAKALMRDEDFFGHLEQKLSDAEVDLHPRGVPSPACRWQ